MDNEINLYVGNIVETKIKCEYGENIIASNIERNILEDGVILVKLSNNTYMKYEDLFKNKRNRRKYTTDKTNDIYVDKDSLVNLKEYLDKTKKMK